MKNKISLYVDDELYEWIKDNAEVEDRSLNKFCIIMLKYFKEHPEVSGLN